MKKALITGVLLLAGAAAATPYYIGTLAQERFAQTHERLQEELVYPQLTIRAGEFQRGWLKSEASTVFSFTPNKKDAEPVVFSLVHHISQIPSPGEGAMIRVDSELRLPAGMAKKLEPYFHGAPLLSARSLVKFDGSEHSTFTSPSYSGPLKGGTDARLEWKGLHATSSSDADSRRVSVELDVPAFTLAKADGTLEVAKLHYKTDLHRGKHDLWMGKDKGSLEKIQFHAISTRHGPANILLSNLDMKSEQSEQDDLVNLSGRFTFDTAEINGMQLKNGVYDVAYRNLDAQSLMELGNRLRAMMRQADKKPKEVIASMKPHIRDLLSKNPELSIRQFEVGTPMGKVSGKLDAALTEALTESMMENPKELMNITDVDLEASLPKPMLTAIISSNARSAVLHVARRQKKELDAAELAQQVKTMTQQQINGLLAQKLMVEDADNFATVIHYTPHKLVINDQDATPMLNGMVQQ